MASLIEGLIDVLEKESLEYQDLLELSMKKTPVIISGDLEVLAKITEEEQVIVGKINRLDLVRQDALKDIANVINKDVEELKLTVLIQVLEKRPSEQQKLAKVYDKLKEVVRNVERTNGQNRELIQNVLEMVEFDMNVLQAIKVAPETANYNREAYSAGSSMGAVPKGFDARQ